MSDSGLSRKQAIATLWNKGILTWKLDPVQKELYDLVQNSRYDTLVWNCSRRLGKSYCLLVLAIETCLKKPNAVVKFIAPTQKHIKMILRPLVREIIKDCPPEIAPKFRTGDNVYRFPNGSEIQLAGTDSGHAETLRGGSSDLCCVDEAGFCSDLRYIVRSILFPTTTTTGGKIILSSTPPLKDDHEFAVYMKEAEAQGNYVKKTIYDGLRNGRITKEIIQRIIDELGGVDSEDFRREYLGELIKSENNSVVPEATESLLKEIQKEWRRPPYFDVYVAADIGFRDLTFIIWGYYDFKAAKIIIEDEFVMNGPKMTTDFLAKAIKQKETELYTFPGTIEVKKPYMRVSDNSPQLINDLYQLHGITFSVVPKDDSEAALNEMRIALKERRIFIHPRCTNLIRHLKNASWNKTRKTYERSEVDGHYDGVDALKYFVRTVQDAKNPYPSGYGKGGGDNWFSPKESNSPSSPVFDSFRRMFKPRS